MDTYLDKMGIQVWRLRDKAPTEDTVFALQINNNENCGYVLLDGTMDLLEPHHKLYLLLKEILNSIHFQIVTSVPIALKDVLPDTSLLIALGKNASRLAAAYQSKVDRLFLISHNLLELLSYPIKKRQVWLELQIFT
jgi:hypothetical protein